MNTRARTGTVAGSKPSAARFKCPSLHRCASGSEPVNGARSSLSSSIILTIMRGEGDKNTAKNGVIITGPKIRAFKLRSN